MRRRWGEDDFFFLLMKDEYCRGSCIKVDFLNLMLSFQARRHSSSLVEQAKSCLQCTHHQCLLFFCFYFHHFFSSIEATAGPISSLPTSESPNHTTVQNLSLPLWPTLCSVLKNFICPQSGQTETSLWMSSDGVAVFFPCLFPEAREK